MSNTARVGTSTRDVVLVAWPAAEQEGISNYVIQSYIGFVFTIQWLLLTLIKLKQIYHRRKLWPAAPQVECVTPKSSFNFNSNAGNGFGMD